MNEKIANNLFEFWDYIGQNNGIYSETKNYKSVNVSGSDWPRRVYAIEDKTESYDEIIRLSSQGLLPDIFTLYHPTGLINDKNVEVLFSQMNMALDLSTYEGESSKNENIRLVETKSDAVEFANIASASFGYRVDGEIVYRLCKDGSPVKPFVYREGGEGYGCGIIFTDKHNLAGFHMIGTVPDARGKGVGKSITENLIREALTNGSKYCVLNASKMGESVYKKLGFTTFGVLENYTIRK